MCHVVGFTVVPLAGVNRPAAERLQGHGRDELLCRLSHHHLHGGAGLDQRAAELCGLVAGNAP